MKCVTETIVRLDLTPDELDTVRLALIQLAQQPCSAAYGARAARLLSDLGSMGSMPAVSTCVANEFRVNAVGDAKRLVDVPPVLVATQPSAGLWADAPDIVVPPRTPVINPTEAQKAAAAAMSAWGASTPLANHEGQG